MSLRGRIVQRRDRPQAPAIGRRAWLPLVVLPAAPVALAGWSQAAPSGYVPQRVFDSARGVFTDFESMLAAVEVHATYSGFADEVSQVALAPDAHAERPFLPDPATLRDRLLLADRGYPSVDYFEAVATHGGAFIIFASRAVTIRGYGPRGSMGSA